ncbi:MAG: iron chaperone [Gemmataceae bacterium]
MASKPKIKAKAKTIDEYLVALSDEKRVALEKLRKTIRAAVPQAEECISYGLPAFRLDGKWVVWFGAAANHCALYGLRDFHKEELKDYNVSGKGTIRFQADNPLPASLIRKLIKARIARNATQHRRAAQRPKRRAGASN